MADSAKTQKRKEKKPSFVDGVQKEWKKISWLPKERAGRQTAVVLIISALLAVLMTLIDSGVLALVDVIMR